MEYPCHGSIYEIKSLHLGTDMPWITQHISQTNVHLLRGGKVVRVIKKWHRRMLGIAPSKRNQSGVAGVPKYARKKAHDVLDNMGGYPTSGIGLRTQPQTAHGFRERANTTRLTEFCGVVICCYINRKELTHGYLKPYHYFVRSLWI